MNNASGKYHAAFNPHVLFALMQKETKKSRPNQMLRWFGRANAHE